jgi:cobalamin synthase
MALAVRKDRGWRPTMLVSVAAAALFTVFLLLPWGNATFLLAMATLFAWIAVVAARLGGLREEE